MDKIGCGCAVLALNLSVYAIGGLIYYAWGRPGMYVVFVGGPLAFMLLIYCLTRVPYRTSEKRREYLREKRKRIRADRESDG